MANLALAERIKDGTRLPPAAPDPDDDYEAYRRADLRDRLTRAGVPLTERTEGLHDRDILSDLAREIEVYLRGLSVAQLACLAYGHTWPVLIPGIKVPKGFRAVPSPQRNGVFLVTEGCSRRIVIHGSASQCGTVRKSQTLPSRNGVRGVFDRGHMRNYAYDDGPGGEWEKRPEGSRLTRLDFTDEIYRRMGRELFTAEYEGNEEQ
jgi:hypothetical protein